jgi:hypothetical protein
MSNKKQNSVDWLINCITEDQMVKAKSLNEWLEIFEQAKAMRKEEIKNAQMDMFNHLNDLPYGLTYFARLQDAEDFADNYKTFGGDNE